MTETANVFLRASIDAFLKTLANRDVKKDPGEKEVEKEHFRSESKIGKNEYDM